MGKAVFILFSKLVVWVRVWMIANYRNGRVILHLKYANNLCSKTYFFQCKIPAKKCLKLVMIQYTKIYTGIYLQWQITKGQQLKYTQGDK
jgi:hypothetical protein